MRKILLTGAGFSRLWGGWLATEAFEFLLGTDDLYPRTREMLWEAMEDKTGFEGVYTTLRNAATDPATVAIFNEFDAAVRGMFFVMNNRYEMTRFPDPVCHFLTGFDAIFTLNQDTLVEKRYLFLRDKLRHFSDGRFFGAETPGLRGPTSDTFMPEGFLTPGEGPPNITERFQPYFKLHGSSNWAAPQSGRLMLVLGGGKPAEIAKYPLLAWNFEQFARYIDASQLVIIGYSFGDQHINEKLAASARAGTRFFIIDPVGVDVLDKRDRGSWKLPPHDDTFSTIIANVDGASRRNLLHTLSEGTIERTKLDHFLTRDQRFPPKARELPPPTPTTG